MGYSDYNASKPNSIVPNSDRIYSDLDLALTKHPIYDDIRPLTDIDAVKNAVKNLLLTNKGERPFQPNVGSGIFDLLFEHANMYTFERVRNNIQDMLYSYEPRINQVKVKIDANDEKHEMHVTVGFNVTGVANDATVDFYLERLR